MGEREDFERQIANAKQTASAIADGMLKRGQAVDATEAEKARAEAADVIMRFHAKRARTVDKEVVDAMMAELQEWRDETEEKIRILEARSREGYNQLHLRPGQGSGTTCGRGHRGQARDAQDPLEARIGHLAGRSGEAPGDGGHPEGVISDDCLRIIVRAEARMADELDRAPTAQGRNLPNVQASDERASFDEMGIDRRRVAEWREIRDAGPEGAGLADGLPLPPLSGLPPDALTAVLSLLCGPWQSAARLQGLLAKIRVWPANPSSLPRILHW